MPAQKRFKTTYPGVYFIMGKTIGSNKPEKIYYISYRKTIDGKVKRIEEKAGRQYKDDMTPARAAIIRSRRIDGELSNSEKRKAIEAQQQADLSKWTITRLWDEYRQNNPHLKGMVTDQNRFQKHIQPVFGSKEPSQLAPIDVDRLRLNLLKKKTPGTVKNVLELLRRIINFGINKQLCDGPGFRIQLPKVNNQKTEDLTQDQLRALLKAIDEDSNIQAANLMRMALFTGMRRGELFRLKWSDIDFSRGFINILNPKGGVDQRLPLSDSVRQLLENHPKTGSQYVFPGRGGHQRKDIKTQVNRIKQRAGLPKDFRALHGLRHVYASMLANSGEVDMFTLQKLLTHKSPAMTQRYAHLRDDTLRKASEIASNLISNTAISKVVPLKKGEKE